MSEEATKAQSDKGTEYRYEEDVYPEIPKPKYKDVSFESKEEFEKWLEETTMCIIEFSDYGQDLLKIWVASNGEIIHANLQQTVWNGLFVDFENLEIFTPIHMSKPDGSNWQRMMGLVVESIAQKRKAHSSPLKTQS